MIIIKTPQPDTEERLVLVHPSTIGIEDDGTFSVRAGNARDATAADLERGGYGKLPMWVTSAADGQKLIGERDEARAAFLGCAQAIGIVYQADGRADEPGPPAAVIAAIKELAKRGEERESELATANEWRERWCRESEAAAVQSNANWQRAKDLEARAEKAEGLLVQRETELRLAREDGAAVERQMREARSAADASFVRANRAEMRAEKAEREREEAKELARVLEVERDEAKAGHNAVQPRVYALEADLAETVHERDTLRAELARLTAPGDGSEPTDVLRGLAYRPNTEHEEDALDAYRLGVAHERARQQPAKGRATDEARPLREVSAELEAMRTTHDERDRVYVGAIASDEELVTVYRRAAEPLGDEHGVSLRDLVRRCQARGVLAVAARVRQERCLVAQAVGRRWYIYVCPRKDDDSKWDIEAGRVIAGRSDGGAMLHAVPAADVPSTLARLLGEVSRG